MSEIQEPFRIGKKNIQPGQRMTIDLPVVNLYTHTEMTMPICVIHGKKPGPRLFVCAAIHGDEINGVAIIRRLLQLKALQQLRGTFVAVPVVNVLGFINHSRYLPDRRDLNRSFPGSEKGSLTARLAHKFMQEVVRKCTHGIDLHTGAIHRSNLPQIRACFEVPGTQELALAFGAPVILEGAVPEGSLREAVVEKGLPMLLYESGEALRFDEVAIRIGVRGVMSVMRSLGMLPPLGKSPQTRYSSVIAKSSYWIRAPKSGILRTHHQLGQEIQVDDLLGIITDPFGEKRSELISPLAGVIIGRLNLPLVNEGDALFHIASFADSARLENTMDGFQAELESGMKVPTINGKYIDLDEGLRY